mmetsp:Transcript_2621/g.2735  ORF Transcript_2621/g.2735 Transcript_2621/m.2735 type:complete len:112 (+) Transcript_2621:165-500(+)
MVKVWFPNLYMRLVSVNLTRKPPQALLYVQPKMTKFEVKEYLSKIYNVKVLHVNTANFLGKWKRFYGKNRIIAYKRRNFKKALVHFEADKNNLFSCGKEHYEKKEEAAEIL